MRSSEEDLLEGWCAGCRVAWRRAREKDSFRHRRALGGNHYEKRGEWLRLSYAAEVYRCTGKDLSILVQGGRVDLVMRMLDLVRKTRRFQGFVIVLVVSMGMPFMRKSM